MAVPGIPAVCLMIVGRDGEGAENSGRQTKTEWRVVRLLSTSAMMRVAQPSTLSVGRQQTLPLCTDLVCLSVIHGERSSADDRNVQLREHVDDNGRDHNADTMMDSFRFFRRTVLCHATDGR
jgi:hypothetical protein